jgi:hypothetical protein
MVGDGLSASELNGLWAAFNKGAPVPGAEVEHAFSAYIGLGFSPCYKMFTMANFPQSELGQRRNK